MNILSRVIQAFKDVFKTPVGVTPIGNKRIPVSTTAPSVSDLQDIGGVMVWQRNALIIDNLYFNGWFQNNGYIQLVAAMCMVESSGGKNRTREVSARDTSYGPMQVTPYTAADLYNRGYRAFTATKENLLSTPGGLYYGMAYIKVLRTTYGLTSQQAITRAYNGGPGYTQNTARATQTLAHWNKVKSFIV